MGVKQCAALPGQHKITAQVRQKMNKAFGQEVITAQDVGATLIRSDGSPSAYRSGTLHRAFIQIVRPGVSTRTFSLMASGKLRITSGNRTRLVSVKPEKLMRFYGIFAGISCLVGTRFHKMFNQQWSIINPLRGAMNLLTHGKSYCEK